MNKYIVYLLLIILLFNCNSNRKKDLIIEFDKSTIFIDENNKSGEVILEGLKFIDVMTSEQLSSSYIDFISLSENKLISSNVFGIKLYKATDELIYEEQENLNFKLKFSYTLDPSVVINEIYSKILKIDSKSYYSEEYETVLVTYFSLVDDIELVSYGSEHISINEETFTYEKTKYITTWDKTKGPYKVQLSELFKGSNFKYILDTISSASHEDE